MNRELGRRPPLDQSRLVGLPAGYQVEVVEQLPSTNALLGERARAGAAEGLVVVTEHQTAGRGRLGRTFETPARTSLTVSVLLRPEVPAQHWPWLPLLTGLVVGRTLASFGFAADLKWPNDVLIADRKVVGILVERVETPSGAAAVLGIGINVHQRDDELPVPTATSLAQHGEAPDRTTLLVRLLQRLHTTYDAWRSDGEAGSARLRADYSAACVSVGREVRVDLPSGERLVGRAAGIDAGGQLLVAGPDGEVAVGAGDVVHARMLPPG